MHNLSFWPLILIIILHIIAKENLDFGSVSDTLIFQAGSPGGTLLCVNITIIDDLRFEGQEIFQVTLYTADPAVDYSINPISIFILDNEGKMHCFIVRP